MRIALYGGSFSPPTKAHQEIIDVLSKEFDEVHILPSYNHVLKSVGVSFEHRFKMTNLLYPEFDNIYVSNDEVYNEEGTMFTLASMISDVYDVEDEFYIVIGEDNAIDILKWKYNRDLREQYKFVVFGRGEHERKDVWYNKDGNTFKPLSLDISSSMFRETLNKDLIDEKVYSYIKENKLYGVEDE